MQTHSRLPLFSLQIDPARGRALLRGAAGLLLTGVAGIALAAAAPGRAEAQAASGVTFSTVYPFTGDTDGANPISGLVADTAGDLYGTTTAGGPYETGSVFKITASGQFVTLHDFGEVDGSTEGLDADGGEPYSALVIGPDGSLYGTTPEGGEYGSGTIFQITPSGTFNTLYNFSAVDGNGENGDGAGPLAALAFGPGGYLYGTTGFGGARDAGTIYKILPSGSAFATLHSFSDANLNDSANYPGLTSPLIFDTQGNLYGTLYNGGANDNGLVFQYTTGGAYNVLHAFSGVNGSDANADGANPVAALVLGSDDFLYGTAQAGGQGGSGTVFRLDTAGSTFTTLYSFTADPNDSGNADGSGPEAALVQGSDGNFYGTTAFGGAADSGAVFSISPTGSFNPLYYFSSDTAGTNSDGNNVESPLVFSKGSLYGTAYQGGTSGDGTVFQLNVPGITPAASTRFDFNADGHADLIWYNTGSGDLSVWDMNDQQVLSYGNTFTQLAPSTGWQPVAAPDVNNDGTPDLLWWNNQSGAMSLWTLAAGNPPSVTSYSNAFATVADTTWKPVAAADVTGTTWELVLQNSASGNISVWQMNGETVTSYGGVLGSLGANSPWQVVGAPDLDGDGHSDLLFWNSSTGEVAWWGCNLQNQQVLSYNGDFAQVGAPWRLVGSEDTNGDGHPDLIWWNSQTGVESRWLLNGTTVTDYGTTTTQVGDTTWQPTAIR